MSLQAGGIDLVQHWNHGSKQLQVAAFTADNLSVLTAHPLKTLEFVRVGYRR